MGDAPLVLLHGVGLDSSVWREVEALLPGDLEVLGLDLLGHGRRPPAPAGTTLGDLADDVASRTPPGSHVVGFSLGALVAQHLARWRPELVATLTCVSSVCRRTDAERAAVLARLAAAEADLPGATEASLRRWFEGTAVDPAAVERTRATLMAGDAGSFLACYRVFATADAEVGPELHRITAPTLAVTGELDPGSTPEMTRRLAAEVPGARAVVVPGARHLLPLERPRELAAALASHVREALSA